jgi:hypothetical protein
MHQDRVQFRAFMNTIMNLRVRYMRGISPERLWSFKENLAPLCWLARLISVSHYFIFSCERHRVLDNTLGLCLGGMDYCPLQIKILASTRFCVGGGHRQTAKTKCDFVLGYKKNDIKSKATVWLCFILHKI